MVSAVLDFGWRGKGRHAPLSWVVRLPSMAAAAREQNGPFDREALRDVERYAEGDYLDDLLRGERDTAAVERIVGTVAAPDRPRSLAGAAASPGASISERSCANAIAIAGSSAACMTRP